MSSKKLLWFIPLLALASCDSAGNKEFAAQPSAAKADVTTNTDSTAMTAANAPLNSPARKIIHTADFRCRVQDVFTATTRMEQIVKSVGGVVQESHMDNSDYDTRTYYYTDDSLRQSTTYRTSAQLTLRVPSEHLDSVINAIPGLTSFIDSRTLKQSDVTYKYLSNELKNQVGTTAAAGTKKGKPTMENEAYNNNRTEQKIDRKVENLELLENINYATVTVQLSQPERVVLRTIVNTDYYAKPPFGTQCKAALHTGWEFVRGTALLLVRAWPMILLLIAGAIIFKFYFRREPAVARK